MTQVVDSLFTWLGKLINPIASLPQGQRFLALLALLQVAVVPFVIEHLPEGQRVFTIYSVTGLFVLLLIIIFWTDKRARKLIKKSRQLIKANRELRHDQFEISNAIDKIHSVQEAEKIKFEKLLNFEEKKAEDGLYSKIILLLNIQGKLITINRNASHMLEKESISSEDMRKIEKEIVNLKKDVETQLKGFSEREIKMAEARELEREIGCR